MGWCSSLFQSSPAFPCTQALLCSSIHPLPELFIYSFFPPSFFLLSFLCWCQMNSCFSSSSAGQGLMWLEHGCSRAGQQSDLLLEKKRKEKGKYPAVRKRGKKTLGASCSFSLLTCFQHLQPPQREKYNENL